MAGEYLIFKQAMMWGKLGRLLRSGAPLIESIEAIAEEAEEPVLRGAFRRLASGVGSGEMISDTLESIPDLFPRSLIVMIRAGESLSRLEDVLIEIPEAVGQGRVGFSGLEREATELELALLPEAQAQVDALLGRALEHGASDAHLIPGPRGGRVCLRVDGVMVASEELDALMFRACMARFKHLAGFDLEAAPGPRHGHIHHDIGNRRADLRLALARAAWGETLVIRLFQADRDLPDLETAIPDGVIRERLRGWVARPHGLGIFCGPDGAGKRTALHALLTVIIGDGRRKIVMVERPVKHRFEGIVQLSADAGGESSTADAVRLALDQNPDVLVVAAPADAPTARLCAGAAAAGRLALMVLHARNATDAVHHLAQMGLPRWQLREDLLGVAAMRLARRLCSECRQAYEPSEEEVKALQTNSNDNPPERLFRAQGCAQCLRTGYRGRVAVLELLEPSTEIWDAIESGAGENELRRLAVEQGLGTLWAAGAGLARRGETSLAEINRSVRESDSSRIGMERG